MISIRNLFSAVLWMLLLLLLLPSGHAATLADGLLPPVPYHYLHPPAALQRGNSLPAAGHGNILVHGGRSAAGFVFTRDGQAGIRVSAGAMRTAPSARTITISIQPVEIPPGLPQTRPDATRIGPDGNAYRIGAVGQPGNQPVQLAQAITLLVRWPYAPLAIYYRPAAQWHELCFADNATYTATSMACPTHQLGTFIAVSQPRLTVLPRPTPVVTPVTSSESPVLNGARLALAGFVVLFVAILAVVVWLVNRRTQQKRSPR